MPIAAERLLNLQCQTVHAFPDVGPANRQPSPNTARNRDHRRARALTTAEARTAGIEPGMRTRTLPPRLPAHYSSPHALLGPGSRTRRSEPARSLMPRPGARELVPPAIDLAGRNLGPASHFAKNRARGKARGHDLPFLIFAPPPAALGAGNHLNLRHRTVTTGANTVICTGTTTSRSDQTMQGGLHRAVTYVGAYIKTNKRDAADAELPGATSN
jgi:hypothetical protein